MSVKESFERLVLWHRGWGVLGPVYPWFICNDGSPIAQLRDIQVLAECDHPVPLLTSGTEGIPKRRLVHWDTILGSVGKSLGFDERWMLTYSLERFAGVQVLAHCLVHGQALVIPTRTNHQEIANEMLAPLPNCISCTPSWMRHFLMSVSEQTLKAIPFRQITLGGEYSNQRILDDVKSMWPDARVTHIYASTEAGTCFAVSDGKEGIPLEKLEWGRDERSGWLDDDGELIVTYQGRNIITGDVFEYDATGERVLFVGRKSEVINVGGYKVGPAYVESILSQVPDVKDIRCYGKRNPLVGECVAIDVVSDNPAIESVLILHARDHLAKPERPMVINVVDKIERSAAGKVLRRKE